MMAGRLIIMDDDFFADFAANTQDMQFSGDNREALSRLQQLAQSIFPQKWSEIVRWPVQCACGHSLEFAVLYYVSRMKCPICQADIGSPTLYQRLTEQDDDRARYHMIVASLNDEIFTFGEEECQALRALSRMSDDVDLLGDAAEDLNVGARYRRRDDV